MKTRKINKGHMRGNIDLDGDILDIMINEYGQKEVVFGNVDFSEAVYSDGFVSAIERGSIPILNSQTQQTISTDKEYHHLILGDECFRMYFI